MKKSNRENLNIIVILTDDLGWTDLNCYGSDLYQTPNIDQLAEEGMKFTDAYASCTVCSPTRASIVTGKYPARLNLTDWISGHERPYAKLSIPDWTQYLKSEETTIAEAIKEEGYVSASIGKWHLGDEEQYWPHNQGFDVNIAGCGFGSPPTYFYPFQDSKQEREIPDLEDGEPGENLTDRLTEEAIDFIKKYKDNSFLLYLPFYAVHTPVEGKK